MLFRSRLSRLSTAYHPQTDGQTERINQELEQYLRVFIDHRQEQWPDWLGTAEFAYNNKIHMATKTSPFKANYGQNPRIGFKGRRKGKYEAAEKFVEKMKKIQEEAKAALGKAQEEMKRFGDRKRGKGEEYKIGDMVLLSMKDLKWQMKGRRSEKLTERFVGPYKALSQFFRPPSLHLPFQVLCTQQHHVSYFVFLSLSSFPVPPPFHLFLCFS